MESKTLWTLFFFPSQHVRAKAHLLRPTPFTPRARKAHKPNPSSGGGKTEGKLAVLVRPAFPFLRPAPDDLLTFCSPRSHSLSPSQNLAAGKPPVPPSPRDTLLRNPSAGSVRPAPSPLAPPPWTRTGAPIPRAAPASPRRAQLTGEEGA